MLYTVAQCDDALMRIDFELQRLTLERQQVVEMRTLLEKAPRGTEGVSHNSYYNPEFRIGTRMQKILQIISEHPGINGSKVKDFLNDDSTPRQITSAIDRLKQKNLVENRGAHGLGAAWYIKESVK